MYGRDIQVHALVGLGIGAYDQTAYIQPNSSVGLVVREVAGMKTLVSLGKKWNPLGGSGSTLFLDVVQRIDFSIQHNLELGWKTTTGDLTKSQVTESMIVYKYVF